jgi:transcriptional regulator with XRE-family HTH domain
LRPLPSLKRLREARGFTQQALASESGVSRSTIAELEQGTRTAQQTTVSSLANALTVSIEELTAVRPGSTILRPAFYRVPGEGGARLWDESDPDAMRYLEDINAHTQAHVQAAVRVRHLRNVRDYDVIARYLSNIGWFGYDEDDAREFLEEHQDEIELIARRA